MNNVLKGGSYQFQESAQRGYQNLFPPEVLVSVDEESLTIHTSAPKYSNDNSRLLLSCKHSDLSITKWEGIEGQLTTEPESFVFSGNDGLHYAKYKRI